MLVATAREKSLVFRGNTLPGVYGAGAFRTLVNRDPRSLERAPVRGRRQRRAHRCPPRAAGGVQVVGLCEALPDCGGYKVHKHKLVRMGVPIHTSHTVVSANGEEEVRPVTVAAIDNGQHGMRRDTWYREDVRL